MSTKHGKVITLLEGIPPTNSSNRLNMRPNVMPIIRDHHRDHHNAYVHKTDQGGSIL